MADKTTNGEVNIVWHGRFGPTLSKHGHRIDELISGLQKYIRRNNPKAIFCLNELLEIATVCKQPRLITNVKNRLRIIGCEDMSFTEAGVRLELENLINDDKLEDAVYLLMESKKLRFPSDIKAYWYDHNYCGMITDEMYKQYLDRFKYLFNRKDEECFGFVLTIIFSNLKLDDLYKFLHECSNNDLLDKELDLLSTYAKTKRKEQWVFTIVAVLIVFHKHRLNWYVPTKLSSAKLVPTELSEAKPVPTKLSSAKLVPVITIKNITNDYTLDDFVKDKHTFTGNQSTQYFAEQGAFVENEDIDFKNNMYREMYLFMRSDKQKESEIFDFIVRAQLVTAQYKTDTYFAKLKCDIGDYKQGQLVFVKGPFFRFDDEFFKIQTIKKKSGLNVLNYKKIICIPDLLTSPMGLRNNYNVLVSASPASLSTTSLGPRKACYFIFCESLYSDIPTKMKKSTKWPETSIAKLPEFSLSSKKTAGLQQINEYVNQIEIEYANQIEIEYAKNVAFRYIFGMNDLTKRNFILVKNKIYSVDEDVLYRDFDLIGSLRSLNFLNIVEKHKFILYDFIKNINYSSLNEEHSKFVSERITKFPTYFEPVTV